MVCIPAPARAFLFVSAVLFLASWLVPFVVEQQLRDGIRGAVVWNPDSPPDTDARFRGSSENNTSPDLLRVWFFNITNLADMRNGARPEVVEVGPFVYQKFRVKQDVWWDREGRVSYKEWDYHLPRPDLTPLPFDTPLLTVNMPLMGVLAGLHAAVGPSYQVLLDLLLGVLSTWGDPQVDGLFMRRTAQELMWGYEDQLLVALRSLLPPAVIPTTRFSFILNQTSPLEATSLPAIVVNTGRLDASRTWQVEDAGGYTHVTSWPCTEKVQGTDAFQFSPGVSRNDSLQVWVYELFRVGVVQYVEDVEHHGLHLLRFKADESQVEPNACYNQAIRGLINVTTPLAVGPTGDPSAAAGPPVFFSLPHFCSCDEAVQSGVVGLSCDPTAHTTFLDIEPTTGEEQAPGSEVRSHGEIWPWRGRKHITVYASRCTSSDEAGKLRMSFEVPAEQEDPKPEQRVPPDPAAPNELVLVSKHGYS